MIFFFAKCGPQFFSKKHLLKEITPVIGDRFGVQKKQISIGNTCPEIQVRALALICLRATVVIVVRKNVLIFLVRKFTLSYPFFW